MNLNGGGNKHTRKRKSVHKTNTHKSLHVNGFINERNNGWVNITVFGEPYERGFASGYLLHKDLTRVIESLHFLVKHELEISMRKFINISNKQIKPVLCRKFPEYYNEIRGISAGAKKQGVNISIDMLIAWNSYMSLTSYITDLSDLKCSAFIATGNATEKGDIIMSHNTHTNFVDGQLHNIIMNVIPSDGHEFVMQTSAGCIASGTDWFICSTGIIGCETTIGDTNYDPKFGTPYFCRIREAMQYGKTLDDYSRIMTTDNAGDYACSWLFGDINSNEIMLCEIGLKCKNIRRTKNGVFYGMNSAIDEKLRKTETTDMDFNNISTSSGARNYRLNELLNGEYKGKINIENSKKIIADHYDTRLRRTEMNRRSICSHCEHDIEVSRYDPFELYGCTDAKVVNSAMAKTLTFHGRFGSGCGRKFNIKKHIRLHPEFKPWEKVVRDFIPYNWGIVNNRRRKIPDNVK